MPMRSMHQRKVPKMTKIIGTQLATRRSSRRDANVYFDLIENTAGLFLVVDGKQIGEYNGGLTKWANGELSSNNSDGRYSSVKQIINMVHNRELDERMNELLDWLIDEAKQSMYYEITRSHANGGETSEDVEALLDHGISVPEAHNYLSAGAFTSDAIISLVDAGISADDSANYQLGGRSNDTLAYLLSNKELTIDDVKAAIEAKRLYVKS